MPIRRNFDDLSSERMERLSRRFSDTRLIYDFLFKHNPTFRELEQRISHQARSGQIIEIETEIVPRELVRLGMVIRDLLEEGGRKVLREKKTKLDFADFQEILGVEVPIPEDILRALGIEAVPVPITILQDGPFGLRNIRNFE